MYFLFLNIASITMTTSLSSEMIPHLDDSMKAMLAVPAPSTGQALIATKDPPGDLRSVNQAILDKASKAYKKLIYRTMYPYGYNYVLNEPTTVTGESPKGGGISIPPALKQLKDNLWTSVVKRTVKKHLHKAPKALGLTIPPRPKLKNLLLKGAGPESTFYTSSGNGVTHSTSAHGGFMPALMPLIGAIGSIAAPLAIEGLKSISSSLAKSIAKRRTEGHGASSRNSGAAYPHHATVGGKLGLVDEHRVLYPIEAMRAVYEAARNSMHRLAEHSDLPAEKVVPHVDAFIKHHARRSFGHGAAHMILNSTARGEPSFHPDVASFLSPILRHSVPSSHHTKLDMLLHKPIGLHTITGSGIGELLAALSMFLSDDQKAPAQTSTTIDDEAFSSYAPKAIKHMLDKLHKHAPEIFKERTKPLVDDMTELFKNPLVIVTSETTGEGYPKSYSNPKLLVKGVGGILDLVQAVGPYVLPAVGTVLGKVAEHMEDTSIKQDEATREAKQKLAMAESEAKKSTTSAAERATLREEARQEREQLRKERFDELKQMRQATEMSPEELQHLHNQVQASRQLSELLSTSPLTPAEKREYLTSHYKSYKPPVEEVAQPRWRMVPSPEEPGRMRREYLTVPTVATAIPAKPVTPDKQARREAKLAAMTPQQRTAYKERKAAKHLAKTAKSQVVASPVAKGYKAAGIRLNVGPTTYDSTAGRRGAHMVLTSSKKT
jgi:hypothetical protein